MVANDNERLDVEIDMPETLPVTPDELALYETYMRDLVVEMVNLEAANDNDPS